MPDQVPAGSSLLGNVYEGTEVKVPFVVIVDNGGERVMVENVDPPHTTRKILRRRLLSYRYRLVGRRAPDETVVHAVTPAPVFDGPRFARWLRAWMSAEGMMVADLVRSSGLSFGVIHALRRGTPTNSTARSGQKALQPSINTIAAVAHGLGLEFSYVAAKCGVGDAGDRWRNFTDAERLALFIALDGETDADDLDSLLRRAIAPPIKEAVS